MTLFAKPKDREKDSISDAANRVANRVARERKRRIARRKWAVESAMMCVDELTGEQRIDLARRIERYVWDEEADT